MVITTAQLHSSKSELRFCVGSNPAGGGSEICDGENLWQWSRLEIRRKRLSSVNHSTKTIHHQFISHGFIRRFCRYHCHHLSRGTTVIVYRVVPQSSIIAWYHKHQLSRGTAIIIYHAVPQSLFIAWYHNHQLLRGATSINLRVIPQSSIIAWYHKHQLSHGTTIINYHAVPQ